MLGPENAATVRGAAVSPDVRETGWVSHRLLSANRRASASRENPKKRKLFFESRRLQPILPLSSSVHQTMDLDAVCARCALSPALSLIKYVKAGRRTANTATNKPSKCKNELLGATWITDFLQKQNFDVDQTALCSSCLSVLEPEFSRWIQPRGGTKEKQLLCAAGFWSCTSQKGLKEAHLGAERELLLKTWQVCSERPSTALKRPEAGPYAGK